MEVVVAAEVLRRVTRTRQTVSLVSQVIIRSYDEESLLAEVCRHLVSFGGYLMAWVGLIDEKNPGKVRPVAHAGLEANFLEALQITWLDDMANRGPTSLAVQEHRPHIARNILKEPRYAVLRREAQLYGYTATCALPLQFAQYGMGVVTIHAMEPAAFSAEEVSLLRELASDLCAGIINLRERGKHQVLEERLAAVVDAADDAIVGVDANGKISDWNQGAVRLYGHSRQEALGQDFGLLLVPPDRREETDRIRAAVASGERPHRFETTRQCKEGKAIHVSVSIRPIFDTNGDVLGSTHVEHDITEERAAQLSRKTIEMEEAEVTRLKALEKVRKTFMSEASHELNTPLTPLRIHVEALGESPDLSINDRNHLVVIERNTLRLCNLVKDMLEASRLETGRFALDLEAVSVSSLVRDAIQNFSEPARTAGVTLEPGRITRLVATADSNRIGQVLYNLLTNALKFTPIGGRITVSALQDRGEAVVRVTDTGLGLTPDQIGQLFQPFARPHEEDVSAPKGTGLGLFISKGIVEQHGGLIWAESAGPNQGSSFCFTLPLAQSPLRHVATPPDQTSSRGAAPEIGPGTETDRMSPNASIHG